MVYNILVGKRDGCKLLKEEGVWREFRGRQWTSYNRNVDEGNNGCKVKASEENSEFYEINLQIPSDHFNQYQNKLERAKWKWEEKDKRDNELTN